MKNIKYVSLLAVLFYACQAKTSFSIKNETPNLLDSIKITNGYDSLIIKKIDKNETKNFDFQFTNLTPNHDGSFFLEIYPEKKVKSFGYYTNGIQPHTHFYIEIKEEVISIVEKH